MAVVAAVDIGTNSVRLLVGRANGSAADPTLKTISRKMVITRLGEGVDESGSLSEEAMARTVNVLSSFRDEALALGAERILPVATSAVREADNSRAFLAMAREALGVWPQVIDGGEEARLSFLGATYDLATVARGGRVLVFDIGGGSTEVVTGKKGYGPDWWRSLPLGCVRMSERYLRSDPPERGELDAAERGIQEILEVYLEGLDLDGCSEAVGLAGTVTTLSGLRQGLMEYDPARIHLSRLSLGDVEEIYLRLSRMTLSERKEYMELDPGRAGVIVGGAAVLVVLMRHLGLGEILVSEKDILDGIAITAAGLGPPISSRDDPPVQA
ncbi:MAG: Ppx/GppA phosphatase family protein [Candidatus Geothermincolales bacterium]